MAAFRYKLEAIATLVLLIFVGVLVVTLWASISRLKRADNLIASGGKPDKVWRVHVDDMNPKVLRRFQIANLTIASVGLLIIVVVFVGVWTEIMWLMYPWYAVPPLNVANIVIILLPLHSPYTSLWAPVLIAAGSGYLIYKLLEEFKKRRAPEQGQQMIVVQVGENRYLMPMPQEGAQIAIAMPQEGHPQMAMPMLLAPRPELAMAEHWNPENNPAPLA